MIVDEILEAGIALRIGAGHVADVYMPSIRKLNIVPADDETVIVLHHLATAPLRAMQLAAHRNECFGLGNTILHVLADTAQNVARMIGIDPGLERRVNPGPGTNRVGCRRLW